MPTMPRRFVISCLLTAFVLPVVFAQKFAPPEPVKPTDEQLRVMRSRYNKLDSLISSMKRQGVRDPYMADIEIFAKATEWIVRHGEFYEKSSVDWTVEELDRGLLRASQMAMGESPWLNIGGQSVIRAYRSRVDGSVQPYAVTLPEGYGTDKDKHYRLDVILHGRDPKLTEIAFLHKFNGDKLAPKGQPYVQLDVYGRGNNAYRWAGETDVLDAVDHFIQVERIQRRELLDNARVVLRGFSMGGAGTWHLGLHRPDKWCVLGPGAGFTKTHGYAANVPAKLPDYIESCLRIYDAVDYAENVYNVPVVAYSGEDDPQLKAARNIEAALKGTDLSITHLIAPKLGHTFPEEWQVKAEKEYARHVKRGRLDDVKRVRFVTYTLKYNRCEWIEILGLDNHYDKTLVDAEKTDTGYKIKTTNVRTLHVTLPRGEFRRTIPLDIDGQALEAFPFRTTNIDEANLYLEKRDGTWRSVWPNKIIADRHRRIQKVPGLQGPIDDAFVEGFICVKGTGKAWNKSVDEYANGALKRFVEEWDKYMRGKLTVIDDVDLKPEEIGGRNLILFGDPGSNRILAQILDALPVEWTEKTVRLGKISGEAAKHVPVLIYPSPLHFDRYVVINSGHTFGAADFKDTNAMLYPRLGDHALLKLAPTEKDPLATEVVGAGIFDEFWRFKK
jgi:pimeloyl-ACP methyl ester carboxylesterase